MSHPSADARAAPFAPSAFGPRVMNPLHRPAPLPATPPRLDQDSARARRSMLGHWIAHTTGHHLDARSDEVRAFPAIPWRVAEITLEKSEKKSSPPASRSELELAARRPHRSPTPPPLTLVAHPPDPPPAQGFCAGLWDGVVLCKLLNALAPGIVARALRADDPSLPDVSPDKFLHAHNYKQFVAGAERLGVADRHLFLLHDLGGVNGDQANVLACLAAVKEIADARARRAKPPRQPQQQPQHPASADASADARVSRVFRPMLADGDDADTPGAAAHSSDGTPMASSATPRRAPQRRATADPPPTPPPIPGLCFESLKRGGDKPSPRGARGDDAPKVPRKEEREEGVERKGEGARGEGGSDAGSSAETETPSPAPPPPEPAAAPAPAASPSSLFEYGAALLAEEVEAEAVRAATPEPPADSDDSDDSNSEEDGFPGFRLAREPAREPLGAACSSSVAAASANASAGSPRTPSNPGGPSGPSSAARGASTSPLAALPGGAALESVLGKITKEYERRLLAKESELARLREDVADAFRREGRVGAERDEFAARAKAALASAEKESERADRLASTLLESDEGRERLVASLAEAEARRRDADRSAAASRNAAADAETRAALMASKTQSAETEASRARMQLEDAKVSLAELAATLEDAEAEKDAAKKEAESVRREAEAVRREAASRTRDAVRAALADAKRSASDQRESLLETKAALMRDVKSLREGVERAREDALRVDEERRASTRDIHAAVEALADRARAYDRAFDENKRLHNEIQDLKGSIRVFCRVRPGVASVDERRGLAGSEASLEASALESSALSSSRPAARARLNEDGDPVRVELDVERRPTFRAPPDVVPGSSSSSEKGVRDAARGVFDTRSFTFDRAFGPEATQRDVYAECSALVRCACDGYNVAFLAYGQTGSGKTYTMSGPNCGTHPRSNRRGEGSQGHAAHTVGVNYRALDDLFSCAAARSKAGTAYSFSVAVLEIYNERCRDLLAASADATVEVKDHGASSGSNAPDATYRPVRTAEDVAAVMAEGEAMRATGATAMNRRSSRSHSVVCVRVDGRSVETGAATRGVLYLVDLAGSERVAKSEATGERLKEAQHINKSLSALGDVVQALREGGAHVPYRNSKLTMLLRGALSPRCGKALVLAHVSPARASAGETLSTLAFAKRVSAVELGKASRNAESQEGAKARRRLEANAADAELRAQNAEDALRRERDARTRAERQRDDAEARCEALARREAEHARRESGGNRAATPSASLSLSLSSRAGATDDRRPTPSSNSAGAGGVGSVQSVGTHREPASESAESTNTSRARPASAAAAGASSRRPSWAIASAARRAAAEVERRSHDLGGASSATEREKSGEARRARIRARSAGLERERVEGGRVEERRRAENEPRPARPLSGDARLGSKMGLLFDADHEDSVFLDEDIAPDVFSSDGVPSPGDASLGEPRRDVSSSAGSATRRRSLSSGASSETRRDRAAASPSGSVTSSLRGDARASSRASDARLAALQRLEAAKAAREEAAARERAEMPRQAARSPFEVRPKSAAAAPKSPAPWPSPPAKAALRPINNRATDGPSSSPRRPSGSPPVADEAPRPRDVPEKSASDDKDDEGAPPAPPGCFASPVAAVGPVVEEVVVKMKKKSMYSRAKAAFGFGKKKKAAQERWQ